MTYISDANDRATILADADTFFLNSGYFAASDADEVTNYSSYFGVSKFPDYWLIGQQTSGLIQVYDLVVPLDPVRATTYLCRLGAIAGALLANRDDTRGFPKDPFRGRVMPAWGAKAEDRDGKWNTDVDTSGLLVYAMAAFARRVLDRPGRYPQFHDQAIALVTAAIETYEAFRPELHLVEDILVPDMAGWRRERMPVMTNELAYFDLAPASGVSSVVAGAGVDANL